MRAFHNVMQDLQLYRQRSGGYGWSVARDIADPELRIERYYCPTWPDYLLQRNRSTQSERALDQQAAAFHADPEPVRVRRMLERPFGSVRWKEDEPDRAASEVVHGQPLIGADELAKVRRVSASRSKDQGSFSVTGMSSRPQ